MRRFACFLIALLASAPALAAPPVEVVSETAPLPPPALRVDLGLGSPVGSLGVVYSRPVSPQLAVEGGLGIGASGLQLSAMGKLRLGSGRTRFTPGVGVSLGIPLDRDSPTFHTGHPANDDEAYGRPVTMGWLDLDLAGVEYRSRGGLVLSVSGGVTFALTKAHWDFIDLGNDIEPFDPVPQLRFGMGWTF